MTLDTSPLGAAQLTYQFDLFDEVPNHRLNRSHLNLRDQIIAEITSIPDNATLSVSHFLDNYQEICDGVVKGLLEPDDAFSLLESYQPVLKFSDNDLEDFKIAFYEIQELAWKIETQKIDKLSFARVRGGTIIRKAFTDYEKKESFFK